MVIKKIIRNHEKNYNYFKNSTEGLNSKIDIAKIQIREKPGLRNSPCMQNKGTEKYESSAIENKFNIYLRGVPGTGHKKNRETT